MKKEIKRKIAETIVDQVAREMGAKNEDYDREQLIELIMLDSLEQIKEYRDKEVVNECNNLLAYTIDGAKKISLRKHQQELIGHYVNNDRVMVAGSRQIGITLLNCIYALNYAIRNEQKRIIMVGTNNMNSTRYVDVVSEILKLNYLDTLSLKTEKPLLRNRPRVHRKGVIVLANGSSIVAANKSNFMDKVGYDRADITLIDCLSFMNHREGNVLVDQAIRNSKCVIINSSVTSYPNAFNELWFSLNDFKKVAYDYKCLPSKSAVWKDEWRNNLGDRQFEEEHENKIKFETVK